MRSFFIQIFLSFWVSTLTIFLVATAIFPSSSYVSPDNFWDAFTRALQEDGANRLADFEKHGCANLPPHQTFLFDSSGVAICGQSVSPDERRIAGRVLASGKRETGRAGAFWVAAQPIYNASGRRYVFVLRAPFHRAPWWPRFPSSALPASALVTFIFAYILTRPVRKLRQAFRRFSAGDLNVRLPVARNRLRDLGGADIRTLMVDFNEMADRVRALLEAHKLLVRDVSHELRSPLARLGVALELAREEMPEPSSALDRVEYESNKLNSLIGELLSLSLLESLNQVPHGRTFTASSLLDSLLPDLEFEAEARGCQLVCSAFADAEIRGNPDVLRRALENIVRNAIRYTPPGASVNVTVQAESARAQSYVVFEISDRGPGVPEESLSSIFRPFYRVDMARQGSTGGFGVGLAIAERAVHLHGGSIRAFNREGGGLCVEVRLPGEVRSPKELWSSRESQILG